MNKTTKPWKCSCKTKAINTGLLPIIAQNSIQLFVPLPTAAAVKSVEASDLILGNDIYLQTPHAVQNLLNSEVTHFSANRLTSYETILLSPPKSASKTKQSAMLLPLAKEGEPMTFATLYPNSQSAPLTNPDLSLSVDGPYCKQKRKFPSWLRWHYPI